MAVHHAVHGTGRPVLVLHGAFVDHGEAEAYFAPALEGVAGLRRIYPDLPGMGRTVAPETLRSADDVPDTLLGGRVLRAGDGGEAPDASRWGRSSAQCCQDYATSQSTASSPDRVAIGDDVFRSYFVIQTRRCSKATSPLPPHSPTRAALERIGERWTPEHGHVRPDERPELLRTPVGEWLARIERSS